MTAPEACGNGTYAPSTGATACTPCPAGNFENMFWGIRFSFLQRFTVSLSFLSSYCVVKKEKYLTGNNSMTYVLGQKCLDVTAAASDCVQGEYSPEGSSLCYSCLDGWYSDSVKSTTCTECPAGSKCPNKNTAPTQCGSGEYR